MVASGGEWGYDERETAFVTAAIYEAMNSPQVTSYRPDFEASRNASLPEPHLPLRKASAQRLQERRHVPQPLFAPSPADAQHQVQGFRPSPVEPLPCIDSVTASNEHAFAGRDGQARRPFNLPLGVQAMRHGLEQQQRAQYTERTGSAQFGEVGRPPSSPLLPSPPTSPYGKPKKLRSSRSLGSGLRGLRHRLSSQSKGMPPNGRDTPDSSRHGSPNMAGEEFRSSFRSGLTTSSSFINTSSINTDRSSLATGNSSHSDFVKIYPNWPNQEEGRDPSMSNDDLIGLYADGFESAKQSLDTQGKRSMQSKRSLQETRPASVQQEERARKPNAWHRRSQSASILDKVSSPLGASLMPPESKHRPTSSQIVAGQNLRLSHDSRRSKEAAVVPSAVPRDRYGFKKVSHHISVEQYDTWDVSYAPYLERRRKKWFALMRSYGLSTDAPFRFPPKSDKIKRYVRKGIPLELRGAAWYWYAGGPGWKANHEGLYWELIEQIEQDELSDNDREHIERDLNRTFPDNVRFKPDPTTTLDAQAGAGGGKKKRKSTLDAETPIVRALRRVLQAFAVYNPAIGYCQSLNFIAGLLLIFLDEDEEKAFVLLNIVTSVHLPVTHGVALEGANIDIAVLMTCIKDSLPAIWAKLDDKGGGLVTDPSAQALRLPTVSLATTAWFMSLFVGTLPIESVLRVWDCLFFEGSKTLFRIALAIFKFGERQILAVNDPMEIFQVVQTIPRSMLDINGLMEVCFKRRGGFGHVSQELIERRREERRRDVREGVAKIETGSRWKGRWRAKTKA